MTAKEAIAKLSEIVSLDEEDIELLKIALNVIDNRLDDLEAKNTELEQRLDAQNEINADIGSRLDELNSRITTLENSNFGCQGKEGVPDVPSCDACDDEDDPVGLARDEGSI